MEARRILIKTSQWSLEQPEYISTIEADTAERVAASLSINLHDFYTSKGDYDM